MGDTGLTVITVFRRDLTEIKPKMGEISKFKNWTNWVDKADRADRGQGTDF